MVCASRARPMNFGGTPGSVPDTTTSKPLRSNPMKKLRILAFLWAIFLAAPVFAQTVKVNWKQGNNFSGYKTYAWKITPQEQKSIYVDWVQADVNAQLAAKGMTQAAAGAKPDVYVAYHLTTQEMVDATTTTDGDGFGGWGWGGGGFWGGWGGWGGWGDAGGASFVARKPHEPGPL